MCSRRQKQGPLNSPYPQGPTTLPPRKMRVGGGRLTPKASGSCAGPQLPQETSRADKQWPLPDRKLGLAVSFPSGNLASLTTAWVWPGPTNWSFFVPISCERFLLLIGCFVSYQIHSYCFRLS